jgi:hypothetical protein
MDKDKAPAGAAGSLAGFEVSMLIGGAESATCVHWAVTDTVRGAIAVTDTVRGATAVGSAGPSVFSTAAARRSRSKAGSVGAGHDHLGHVA